MSFLKYIFPTFNTWNGIICSEERLIVRKADQLGRERPHKITAIKADGCGRERTKVSSASCHSLTSTTASLQLPIMRRRPKSVPDAELVMADIFGVQISCQPGTASSNQFNNYDQVVPMDAFSHSNTNHYVSCLLRAVVKVSIRSLKSSRFRYYDFIKLMTAQEDVLGTTWVLTLDNAPCNKTSTMFASLGFVLEQIPNLESIYVLFSSVGHTHNEMDGHFGTMTKSVLPKKDLMTHQGLPTKPAVREKKNLQS